MRPDTFPACDTSSTARRMANGDTQPSSVIGTLNRMSAATNDPASSAALKSAKPIEVRDRIGWATNGTRPITNAAQVMMRYSTSARGERSAQRPPRA